MSDISNMSGQPDRKQRQTTHNQDETGATYWESKEIQNLYGKQISQDPADHYKRVQDITYDEFKNKQFELQQKNKSLKKPILATIVVLFILIASASAYAFSGTIRTTIDLLIKSTRDYYVSLENKSAKRFADISKTYMGLQKSGKNTANSVSAKLSYDKDTVGSLLKSYTGIALSDIESMIGIPLDSIGLDYITANKDNENYQKFNLNLNNVNIISGELFTDYDLKQLLLYFSDLSPAYLKLSLDSDLFRTTNADVERLTGIIKILAADGTGDFVKRYVKLITDEIEDVQLSRKEQLTVGNITKEANLLTAYIYPETFKNIFTKALDAFKNDEYILNLLPQFRITRDEFLDELNRTLDDIKKHLDRLPQDKELMVIKLYVSNDGSILGRKIEMIVENTVSEELGSFYVEQDNKGAYNFYIDNLNRSTLKITGSHVKENGSYTGSLTFKSANTGKTTDVTVDYEGLKLEVKNNKAYAYGSLSILSYDLMGMDIVLELDVKDDAQASTFMLKMGKASLLTLETLTRQIENFDIPKPDKGAKVYDIITESEAYNSTIDYEGFLSKLSDKLGINLKGLIEGLIPMY